MKAIKAVLPPGTTLLVVGGVTVDTMADWQQAGASGYGIGAAVYRPGDGPREVSSQALRFVEMTRQLGMAEA